MPKLFTRCLPSTIQVQAAVATAVRDLQEMEEALPTGISLGLVQVNCMKVRASRGRNCSRVKFVGLVLLTVLGISICVSCNRSTLKKDPLQQQRLTHTARHPHTPPKHNPVHHLPSPAQPSTRTPTLPPK